MGLSDDSILQLLALVRTCIGPLYKISEGLALLELQQMTASKPIFQHSQQK